MLRGYGRKIHGYGSPKTKDENEKLSAAQYGAMQYDAMRCDVVWYGTIRSSSRDDNDDDDENDDDDDKDEDGDGDDANLRKPNENRDGIRERWIYYPERSQRRVVERWVFDDDYDDDYDDDDDDDYDDESQRNGSPFERTVGETKKEKEEVGGGELKLAASLAARVPHSQRDYDYDYDYVYDYDYDYDYEYDDEKEEEVEKL
ncbi:hypothetical protein HZH68_005977 [Vespula germanica]|uniref:Uncharacterized protein n=1 Tax=Vespula germanica TaxID=30212 RepID=A0A834KAP6_VESGE|nr:hypothetical protein HZH68_005977 [Vespula germanica]